MTPSEKIALFVGSDVTAHLVLNKIVPEIIRTGYEPVIFLPAHKSAKAAQQPELAEAGFLERRLTNEVVYPFLEAHPYPGEDKNLSPAALAKRHKLTLEKIDNVNDPAFVDRIRNDRDIVGGLSVRCFQIFQPEIIEAFREREFFLNLHPGILPQFRGVLSTVRAMAAGEKGYGWTLHHIDQGIDTGDSLWVSAKKLDLSKTGLLNQIDMAQLGADSIKRALEELDRGNLLKGHPQDGSKGNYYTYPTRDELDQWKRQNIRLADADEVRAVLVEKFSDATTRNGRLLSGELAKAIDQWKASPENCPPGALDQSLSRRCPVTTGGKKPPRAPQLSYGT